MNHRIIDTTWEEVGAFLLGVQIAVLVVAGIVGLLLFLFPIQHEDVSKGTEPLKGYNCAIYLGTQEVQFAHLKDLLDDCGNHALINGGIVDTRTISKHASNTTVAPVEGGLQD